MSIKDDLAAAARKSARKIDKDAFSTAGREVLEFLSRRLSTLLEQSGQRRLFAGTAARSIEKTGGAYAMPLGRLIANYEADKLQQHVPEELAVLRPYVSPYGTVQSKSKKLRAYLPNREKPSLTEMKTKIKKLIKEQK